MRAHGNSTATAGAVPSLIVSRIRFFLPGEPHYAADRYLPYTIGRCDFDRNHYSDARRGSQRSCGAAFTTPMAGSKKTRPAEPEMLMINVKYAGKRWEFLIIKH